MLSHQRDLTSDFNLTWTGLLTDDRFIESFRLSRDLFGWLGEQLGAVLQRDVSGRGAPMPVEKVIGLALYRWASGASYRVVADVFKVGRSTVFEACREVASSIVAKLLPNVIKYASCEI